MELSTTTEKLEEWAKGEGLPVAGEEQIIPENVFPVPAGEISHTESAHHIFKVIAPTRRLFIRADRVTEVQPCSMHGYQLETVSEERFASLVETFGRRVARREEAKAKDGTSRVLWRRVTYPLSAAKVALASDAARSLPPIRQVLSSPIIVPSGKVLGRGYHDENGGTLVTGGEAATKPLSAAVPGLLSLLDDFNFKSPGDKSRAVASLISPSLKMGGWIDDDFPLDLAEADKSQSGKTYRQKLVAAIYGESPQAITASVGGVGSLDEAVSAKLIAGRTFIALDNVRGKIDSAVMEAAIRGHRFLTCRALRRSAVVDCSPFLWQLSTNGAELTRDLANRSIITRIMKKPAGVAFRTYPEGDLLRHVAAKKSHYLGCVFAVVRAWAEAGCPRTDESRHDFRGWCQALDWIVQNIMGQAPLLDGHQAEQARVGNPKLQWLREVCKAAEQAGLLNEPLTTTDLIEPIEDDPSIEWPIPIRGDNKARTVAGRILKRIFAEADSDAVEVDGFRLSRAVEETYDQKSRHTSSTTFYRVWKN